VLRAWFPLPFPFCTFTRYRWNPGRNASFSPGWCGPPGNKFSHRQRGGIGRERYRFYRSCLVNQLLPGWHGYHRRHPGGGFGTRRRICRWVGSPSGQM